MISDGHMQQHYNENLFIFWALAVHLIGTANLETSIAKIFNGFLENSYSKSKQCRFDRYSTNSWRWCRVKQLNLRFWHWRWRFGGKDISEMFWWKRDYKKKLFWYNNHIVYVKKSTNSSKVSDAQLVIHFSKFSSIQPSSICCKDQIKNVFPQNCLQSLWQLNWKQNLFKSVAVFDCGSLLVPSKEVKLTKTKTKIGTHEPISVSISSNLNVKQYFCVAKMHNT